MRPLYSGSKRKGQWQNNQDWLNGSAITSTSQAAIKSVNVGDGNLFSGAGRKSYAIPVELKLIVDDNDFGLQYEGRTGGRGLVGEQDSEGCLGKAST